MFLLPQTDPDYAFLAQKHGIADKSTLIDALLAKTAEGEDSRLQGVRRPMALRTFAAWRN